MPKTIRTKVYKFNELKEQAKQTAIENYRESSYGDDCPWDSDNIDSFKKFADIWPIQLGNWSVGGQGEGVPFRFNDDNIEELSGQRLATYIWNNFKDEIFSKKYYKSFGYRDKPIKHRKVKNELCKFGENKGKYYCTYYGSKLEEYNCPLTGYCMDNNLIDEVWKFLKKPDSRNFRDLLEDCFNEWMKQFNADRDYMNTDEYITEEIENRDMLFTKDGKQFNY